MSLQVTRHDGQIVTTATGLGGWICLTIFFLSGFALGAWLGPFIQ